LALCYNVPNQTKPKEIMKKIIFLASFTLLNFFLFAQEDRTHDGFYLSLGLGPLWGTTNGYDNQGNVAEIKGTGAELDLQIGLSVSKNLILHGTLISKAVAGPEINGIKVPNDYSLGETMIGAGITHYTHQNFFFSGSIGSGKFSFSDVETSVSTKGGFSFLLKAGKEWWVSKKTGLGVAFTYGKTKVSDESGGYTENWNTNRYGVLLHMTID
jgi:hypothetical protein